MDLQTRLQALREEHNFSQEQLAEQLGVTRQSVSKWENGNSKPDLDNLLKLAELYKVSVDSIVKDKRELSNQEKMWAIEISVLTKIQNKVIPVNKQYSMKEDDFRAFVVQMEKKNYICGLEILRDGNTRSGTAHINFDTTFVSVQGEVFMKDKENLLFIYED